MTPALMVLGGMLAVVVGWYVFESWWDRRLFTPCPGRVTENVDAAKAAALLRTNEDVQVLDVRSAEEFAAGSIPGARNVPLGAPAFREGAGKLEVDKPVLVYCAGGYRSRKAVPILREMGFASIHHLHRGFMSWKRAGLPVASAGSGDPARR